MRWPRWPQKVRTRLTLLYAALFLLSGSALLALTYGLVAANLPATSTAASAVGFDQNQLAKLGVACKQPNPDPGTVLQCKQAFDAGARAAAGGVRQHTLDSLLTFSLVGLAAMTVASGGLGWYVSGRVLRPVRAITETARRASDQHLGGRLALTGPRDELKELADTFDARVRRSIDRAEAMIEALLVLAISDQGGAGRELLDLSALAEDALELAAPAIGRLGLTVQAELAPAEAAGDQQLVERMVWNLVDNAVRHNHPDGWIKIVTGRVERGAFLTIANSGALVPAEAVPTLTEPFRRLGPKGRDGAGLGLSIARSVSAAHGAELKVRSQPGGGLAISVVLSEPDSLAG